MINFSIGGTPYQAEEGMTWEQWVNSKYNVENDIFYKCVINLNNVVISNKAESIPNDVALDQFTRVSKNELIKSDYKYVSIMGK